ncbi:DUF4419 domain-containing protein [Catellatospora sp. NPDC049609]|uniref:DUF4419 domain-containing protein n=1 Tax=Catellatospora sp. NPDC049609 TaxID=3155505 RepID=UPI0034285E7F
MVTFQVDDVTPAAEALPTVPLAGLWPDALAVGGDPALPVLASDGVHPLLSAVGRAFAEHRPLVLSPDAVWLTIAQGVARHIRLHAEELRPLLVHHTGRKRLTVTVDGPMPHGAHAWRDLSGRFQKLLAAEVADAELFDCDFSTSTDEDRIAGRIVLLEAYAPYFSLWLDFICGIPSITLTGTVDDWRRIRARVDAIAALGLEQWCRSLAPIADQFVRAASGDVDVAFWRRIYHPAADCGGDMVTGWAARLYPYLADGGTVTRPNPLLALPLHPPRQKRGHSPGTAGIASADAPALLSRVIVNVTDAVAGEHRAVALHGGLVAVTQDGDGALRPVAGWCLTPAAVEIDDVLDRLVCEHQTTPPLGNTPAGPAELAALYHRIGSATLFDGGWRILPADVDRGIRTGSGHWLIAVAELGDGRYLAALPDHVAQTTHWVICRAVRRDAADRWDLADDPADVPVYGTSLALLLATAMDGGGDITRLETGRLSRLPSPSGG